MIESSPAIHCRVYGRKGRRPVGTLDPLLKAPVWTAAAARPAAGFVSLAKKRYKYLILIRLTSARPIKWEVPAPMQVGIKSLLENALKLALKGH